MRTFPFLISFVLLASFPFKGERIKGDWMLHISTSSSLALSPLSGKIVFSSTREGHYQIYVMNPDGTGATQFRKSEWDENYIAVSRDGRKVAFCTNRHGKSQIYSINADCSGLTRVTKYPNYNVGSAWSPDGNHIIFMRNTGHPKWQLFAMDSDGANCRLLIKSSCFPDWSPDGSRIAFCSDTYGSYEIFVSKADGEDIRRITFEPFQEAVNPRWSPDGKKILFSAWQVTADGYELNKTEFYTVDANGLYAVRITNNTLQEGRADWSPDGGRIIFDALATDGTSQLFIINSNGSNMRQLTHGPGENTNPIWVR